MRVNLFIGIKDTGTFQHSSFLSGGLVISARFKSAACVFSFSVLITSEAPSLVEPVAIAFPC